MAKKGFTLAEIMIVLTVIGVLTAILLPVAFHGAPDENVLKFKKANNTLGTVIKELVSSGEYYTPGDLGKDKSGNWVTKKDYFLRTFADVISVKEVVYPPNETGTYNTNWVVGESDPNKYTVIDTACKTKQASLSSYVVSTDNVYYYEYNDSSVYGADSVYIVNEIRNPFYHRWDQVTDSSTCKSMPAGPAQTKCIKDHLILNGFYYVHKIFCIDVDGINKGEDPFGYGIRVDGKILVGKRASEWILKSAQEKD